MPTSPVSEKNCQAGVAMSLTKPSIKSSSNALKRYQSDLLAAIMQPNSDGNGFDNNDFDNVGLTIYQNNFLASAKRSLANSFPAVKALLEENFDVAVNHYLRAHLKTNADWALIGEQFASYLANEPALSALPYLGDLAEFEYAMFIAERASDKALALGSLSLLEKVDSQHLKMNFAPGFALLNSPFPIAELRSLLTAEHGNEQDTEQVAEQAINQAFNALLEQPIQTHYFAVYRVGYQAKSLSLSAVDYLGYERFSSSASINDALVALEAPYSQAEHSPEQGNEHKSEHSLDEFDLSHWLADAIKHQLLLGIFELSDVSKGSSAASNTS
ncbi:HvfC/BufC N-terminal domain-containing protein [Thalassotalea euphylliae]|uniref:DUF2063 domain-containing protein n=1 Tax=Thalassotalea euphylliae TaxID=1655234 RepID=A0A3E0U140_9GAMM|nr:DNA-binding domain-containing protein [Thalassotalea euphylliae]REL29945.1 DUF2063 domain-containing protein [Thalassotalea euphylliae]